MRPAKFVLLAALLMVSLQSSVNAQSWPSAPVRLVVPLAPGGAIDLTARIVAEKLGPVLGQPVIVENHPGASARIGSAFVAKAKPDGYTILITDSNHGANPALHKTMPYDTLKDFDSVIMIAELPAVLVVPMSSSAQSVRDLVEFAKKEPGKLNYSSPGVGSMSHLATELMKQRFSLDIMEIPYQGGGPALTAIIAGQADMLFIAIPPVLQQIKSGRVKALAVTSLARSPILPEVPTMAESGVTDFLFSGSIGMAVPAGTPPSVVDKVNAAMNKILSDPDVKHRLASAGEDLVGGPPARYTSYLESEISKWSKTFPPAVRVD